MGEGELRALVSAVREHPEGPAHLGLPGEDPVHRQVWGAWSSQSSSISLAAFPKNDRVLFLSNRHGAAGQSPLGHAVLESASLQPMGPESLHSLRG
jgi:hypothetical protein